MGLNLEALREREALRGGLQKGGVTERLGDGGAVASNGGSEAVDCKRWEGRRAEMKDLRLRGVCGGGFEWKMEGE